VTDTAIRVEGLAKHYGDVAALSGIDFEVPAGTVFGLLGPNGAGKTTAVRILATVLRPDGGHAEVMGHDVVKEAATVRFLIGLAGQSAAVDANLTGRENLSLIGVLAQMRGREVGPRAAELLERFDLAAAADRTVKTYSGGMRRRLDVAAALVSRPPVLFLDEPTTGLDIQSRMELWNVIRELIGDGHSVLLTTQYLEEADRLANRVAVVDGGRVVANDTTAALKARLGDTVIEITMPDEGAAIKAAQLLSRLATDAVEREGSLLRLASGQATRLVMQALRELDDHDLAPAGLSVREPSLDDVFLALTGHHAEDVVVSAGAQAAVA
jgi:daunorubicin resistance ABC transporter ATP-binding subunit